MAGILLLIGYIKGISMKKTYFVVTIALGMAAVSFQNCSRVELDFQEVTSKQEVLNILNKCNEAEKQNRLVVSEQQIRFEDSHRETGRSQVCEFDRNDNLSQRNDFMQARYEQHQELNLPADAVICDIEMSTQLQRFRYDDVFFFTFNDRILATNNKSALLQRVQPETTLDLSDSSKIPLYKYDWLSLRGAAFVNRADDYCLGSEQNKAHCTWPVSEKSGNILFEFDPELLVNLGVKASAQKSRFGFIVTGDNDANIDCAHERLEFSIKVKYYRQ